MALAAVRGAQARLPTPYGEFAIVAYRDIRSGKEHAALVAGDVEGGADVLVRVHSECLTGEVFDSERCDCGPQLREALARLGQGGRGVLLYLRQEGRDIGLIDKVAAYGLQDEGLDTVDANLRLGHPIDARTYDAARDMLRDLGVVSARLLTNNPAKVEALRRLGVVVTGREALEVEPQAGNQGYLVAKKVRMGHLLDRV